MQIGGKSLSNLSGIIQDAITMVGICVVIKCYPVETAGN